jgi:plastocyanin
MAILLGLGALIVTGPVLAADSDVSIPSLSFDPETVTIDVGDTVTWTNDDNVAHTVTADDDSFDSGPLSPGSTETVTFASAGTYAYHCTIHSSMTGTIVVEAAAGAAEDDDMTPAPTDTIGSAVDAFAELGAAAISLAVLGLAMLFGTWLAGRRFGNDT